MSTFTKGTYDIFGIRHSNGELWWSNNEMEWLPCPLDGNCLSEDPKMLTEGLFGLTLSPLQEALKRTGIKGEIVNLRLFFP